jgi:hypothetical protein
MVVSSLTLVVTGCVSSGPPAGMVPAGSPVTRVEQLSGEYCYFGPDFNVRSYRRDAGAIPFINVGALGQPTRVSVIASAAAIVFSYTGRDDVEKRETFAPANARAVWRGNAFEIDWQESATRAYVRGGDWGFSWSSRESRLFKLPDGRLVMTDSVKWKGYSQTNVMLFHSDKQVVAVILDVAKGNCAADAASRAGLTWWGSGPDLRDAICAARLEEQLAAILIEKGETPEGAETLAEATMAAFARDERDPSNFSVESPSGTNYAFEVVAKASSACVLRLYRRSSRHSSETNTIWYLARRPLPGCLCNP